MPTSFWDQALLSRAVYTPVLYAFEQFWYVLLVLLVTASATMAAIHAALNKREVRAAIGWIGIIVLVPLLGSVLYYLLGINRIQRRASALFGDRLRLTSPYLSRLFGAKELEALLPPETRHLTSLYRLVDKVSRRPITPGNHITPLIDGDEAYPMMLDAIHNARRSISLCTYIFDSDSVGLEFVQALGDAVQRGVEVRALIDAVGARYSFPPIHRQLQKAGVEVAVFMPTRLPWRLAYANLRNHRKIMVVDGTVGFTGGMNIREGHLLSRNPSHPVQDLHFRVEGPVVGHLQETFCEDWAYTTGNAVEGPLWFPEQLEVGTVASRGLSDGPDEDFEHIRWSILGALASAEYSVRIMTPYFLPDSTLISALNVAAMRGIEVEILVPSQNNLTLVQWASTAHYGQLLNKGCHIYETPPPFDHTKIMIVDGAWVLLGSANWDPRSLRLNFEFNLECYDRTLAQTMDAFFAEKRARSTPISIIELKTRPLFQRIRNGFARLLSPYL